MPNMNAGHNSLLLQTLLNEIQIVSKGLTTIQLHAQTNFHGYLKMIMNKESGHFSSFSGGFRKILSRSDEQLPSQA